jgi:class 3 adenylate cyclase/tetratricopeptide (TPR) repeat protein
MTACPSCAHACPDDARFCPACGAALAAPPAHAVERKVVSIMFCDLVDFTGLCEAVDAEDVERLLRDFYALARSAVEIYGGIVEKFVGDAAVGIFGVPTAHEDDAERAVLSALRLREHLSELPQIAGRSAQVRIGINTGAALVRLDVHPSSGAGVLVGDAVNTAARLQQLAPPMGIVVGPTTQALSARAIDYVRLDPAALKGKRGAVKCWLVQGRISRLGVDLRQQFAAPMVGREVELGILTGLLKKVRSSGEPHLALVVGEPGIGKSRLVFELLRYIDNHTEIVRWRQGRCPAYGDGLSFWAVGEIVREQLGVLERDEPATVEAKLAHGLAGAEDRDWLASRLRPLLGLQSSSADSEENFAAWQRFFELIATDAPAVVVFEDLHWASEGTLAFLDHLSANLGGVPLLVIGTTRPGLLRRRPDLAARLAEKAAAQRGTRLELGPLSDMESEKLVMYAAPDLGALHETRRAVIGRCAGNPLFAEQLVCLLEETRKGTDEESAETRSTTDVTLKDKATVALPESLQSLIGARLDGLPPARKTQLTDAAVVGEVFWSGAVAALDHGDRNAAEEGLRDLAMRELIRRDRESSLPGESEFAFRHALIRDVAYGRLTRSERARKHAAVARWLELTAGDRKSEVAEVLAHHYRTALELSKATADDSLTAELLGPTVEALRRAGDGALPLDVTAAERHYAQAVELAGDSVLRPHLLIDWAQALRQSGRLEEAASIWEEGIRGLQAVGDESAARAAARGSRNLHWVLLHREGRRPSDEEIERLIGEGRRSAEHAGALVECADRLAYGGRYGRALQLIDLALAIYNELRLPHVPLALDARGYCRCALGDDGGLDDLRRAREIADSSRDQHLLRAITCDLGECLEVFEGPASALAVHGEVLKSAVQVHDEMARCFCGTLLFADRISGGDWDTALASAEELDSLVEGLRDLWDLVMVRAMHALLLVRRGESAGAAERAVWAEEHSCTTPVHANRVICLVSRAAVEAALGNDSAARSYLDACARLLGDIQGADPSYAHYLPEAIRLAIGLEEPLIAERLAAGLPAGRPYDSGTLALLEGLLCERRGDYTGAVEQFATAEAQWERLGVPYERAQAALARGRCLKALGRRAEARAALAVARRIFAALGAQPALVATEALSKTAAR